MVNAKTLFVFLWLVSAYQTLSILLIKHFIETLCRYINTKANNRIMWILFIPLFMLTRILLFVQFSCSIIAGFALRMQSIRHCFILVKTIQVKNFTTSTASFLVAYCFHSFQSYHGADRSAWEWSAWELNPCSTEPFASHRW